MLNKEYAYYVMGISRLLWTCDEIDPVLEFLDKASKDKGLSNKHYELLKQNVAKKTGLKIQGVRPLEIQKLWEKEI